MEVRLAVGVGLGSGGANGVGTGGKATEKEAVARFFQAGQGRPPHKGNILHRRIPSIIQRRWPHDMCELAHGMPPTGQVASQPCHAE